MRFCCGLQMRTESEGGDRMGSGGSHAREEIGWVVAGPTLLKVFLEFVKSLGCCINFL